MTLHCAVIDDEPLARECISNYIRQVDFLTLSGIGSNPLELTAILANQKVDLVFLDIQMPVMNGIEFLKMVQNPPMVIITTAYPNFAVEGFQLDVMDYLLKPITFSRFFKAVCKAKDYNSLIVQTKEHLPAIEPHQRENYFFIKCDYKYEKIYFDEILYIEGLQNYITIFTQKGKYVTLLPLKNIEEKLGDDMFIRVHKSYLVSIPKVEAIEHSDIIIRSIRIPISRRYREQVLERILNNQVWMKSSGMQ